MLGMCLGAHPLSAQRVIPVPLSMEYGVGRFQPSPKTGFYTNVQGDEALALRNCLAPIADFGRQQVRDKMGKNTFALLLCPQSESLPTAESYTLSVTPQQVVVRATSGAGLFYGIQTLLQLADNAEGKIVIPAVEIKDTPRFEYRGIMLDVSRHFFTKEHLKKQIDALSRYKINRLHIHLTDGAGWRIQIDKYPRLTDFAAWRKGVTWRDWCKAKKIYLPEGHPEATGGYYTKDDIREIVEYARRHYMTVIPEIEMPAHTEEVLAAYPQLSCSGEPYKNTDFCVGNEETFTFLENVLTEVMELFPSEYIHVGGDEAGKKGWVTCPKCQKRMQEENLSDVDELQSYLIRRVERFLNSKGRKLLGWDEILEGGLAPNATVMSWRGEEGGIAAATSGHRAIMTPGAFCYFDSYQDAPLTQPDAIGGYLPLEKVYSYDPLPSALTAEQGKLIYGVQANLWAEFISTPEHAEYMLYPRALALAEVAWSAPGRKSWPDFYSRALRAADELKAKGYRTFDLRTEKGSRPESQEPVSHLALGKKVIYHAPYNSGYAAGGEKSLTDGLRGNWTFKDGVWQGFNAPERLDVTIDLEQSRKISEVYADFIQVYAPDIYLPVEVAIAVSDDGESFRELTRLFYTVEPMKAIDFKRFGWQGETSGRFIRFQAKADKKLDGWIFTDEIIVK